LIARWLDHLRGRVVVLQFGDGDQQTTPMADCNNAQVLKILGRQMR
jgi:hypothetical protein